jgi:prepilin-type N-terminal cleavage/methylation domain-containing protein
MSATMERERKQPRSGGFTLLELLITIVLIALLAALALPYITQKNPDTAVRQLAYDTQGVISMVKSLSMGRGVQYELSIDFDASHWMLYKSESLVDIPQFQSGFSGELGSGMNFIPLEQPTNPAGNMENFFGFEIVGPTIWAYAACLDMPSISNTCSPPGSATIGTHWIFFRSDGSVSLQDSGTGATARNFTIYLKDDVNDYDARHWRVIVMGGTGFSAVCHNWEGECSTGL